MIYKGWSADRSVVSGAPAGPREGDMWMDWSTDENTVYIMNKGEWVPLHDYIAGHLSREKSMNDYKIVKNRHGWYRVWMWRKGSDVYKADTGPKAEGIMYEFDTPGKLSDGWFAVCDAAGIRKWTTYHDAAEWIRIEHSTARRILEETEGPWEEADA